MIPRFKNPFLREKEEKEYFFALDVGTEAVKALIFHCESGKIIISGYSSKYFDDYEAASAEERAVSRTIGESIKKASRNFLQNARGSVNQPKAVLLGLSGNLLKARIGGGNFQRSKPEEIISKKEEEDVIQAVLLTKAKEEALKAFGRDLGLLPRDIQFVGLEILDRKINGYEVPKFQGYNGRDLNFLFLSAALPKHYLENFQSIIKDSGLQFLRLVHPALSLAKVFSKTIPEGLFLDIGGEITSIFLIKGGKLNMIEEIEIGGKDFSRAISQKLGISEKEARLLKEKYVKGLLSEEAQSKIKEIISGFVQDWFFALCSKLRPFDFLLPVSVFIFGGGLVPEVVEILEKNGPREVFPAAKLKVKLVRPEDLEIIEDRTGKLVGPEDVSAALICL